MCPCAHGRRRGQQLGAEGVGNRDMAKQRLDASGAVAAAAGAVTPCHGRVSRLQPSVPGALVVCRRTPQLVSVAPPRTTPRAAALRGQRHWRVQRERVGLQGGARQAFRRRWPWHRPVQRERVGLQGRGRQGINDVWPGCCCLSAFLAAAEGWWAQWMAASCCLHNVQMHHIQCTRLPAAPGQ